MIASAFSAPVELLLYGAGAWYFLKGAALVTRFIQRHVGGNGASAAATVSTGLDRS